MGSVQFRTCVKIWNKPVSLALLRYKRDAGSHGIAWRLRPVWTPAQIHSTLPDLLKTIDRSEPSASDRLEMDDVLIVTKMDRLGRNAMDVTATVDRLAKLGIRVYCLALGGADLASAAGRMTMQLINAVAQFERDLLIERTNQRLGPRQGRRGEAGAAEGPRRQEGSRRCARRSTAAPRCPQWPSSLTPAARRSCGCGMLERLGGVSEHDNIMTFPSTKAGQSHHTPGIRSPAADTTPPSMRIRSKSAAPSRSFFTS